MLIAVQHPFADSRRFLDENANLIKRPSWPSPPLDEFVRCFGAIRERRLGGLEFWGEDRQCDAKRGIRFSSIGAFAAKHRKVTFEVAFRRLFFDGMAVGKLEVGIATLGRLLVLRPEESKPFLHQVFSMQVKVPDHGTNNTYELGGIGKHFLNSYVAATTHTKGQTNAVIPPWAIESGSPVMFVQVGPREDLPLPFFTYEGPDLERWGIEISCCLVPYKQTNVRVWICRLSRRADRTVARSLRLSLMRLHAEHECIRLVCQNILSQRLFLSRGTDQSERLQDYLNQATRRIARSEKSAINISMGDGSIVDLSRLIADGIRPGERDSLLEMLRQASVRKNIVKKMAEYTQQIFNVGEMHMSFASEEYNVGGGAGAVGHQAHASTVNIANYQQAWQSMQSKVDLGELASELGILKAKMVPQATSPQQFAALAEVASAQEAAEQKDGPTILSHLKRAGTWALDVAKEIGVTIASDVIKSSLGIP
jgi:hypothetical protein